MAPLLLSIDQGLIKMKGIQQEIQTNVEKKKEIIKIDFIIQQNADWVLFLLFQQCIGFYSKCIYFICSWINSTKRCGGGIKAPKGSCQNVYYLQKKTPN